MCQEMPSGVSIRCDGIIDIVKMRKAQALVK